MENQNELYREANYCQRCGAKLAVQLDREGKLRGICSQCGFILYRNPIPAVAVVALNEYSELLIIKRLLEPNAGMWALPSGYIEINLTPEANAIAELREETGLLGSVDHFIDWFYGYSPIYYRVLSLGFRMNIISGVLQAGDDAGEAMYCSLDKLPPIAFEAHKHFIRLETGIALS